MSINTGGVELIAIPIYHNGTALYQNQATLATVIFALRNKGEHTSARKGHMIVPVMDKRTLVRDMGLFN